MKRFVQTTLGVLLVLLATGAIAAGAVLLAAFGRDGTVSVSSQPIKGPGAALVTEDLDVAGTPLQQKLGTLSFGARSDDGVPLFLGLAGSDDVFGYLDGVPYDVVAGVGSSTVVLRPVPGEQAPASPAQQGFWHAQAIGKDPEFAWPSTTGEGQRLVVMNANGSRGVGATLTVTFRSTTVFPIAVGCLIGGALALLLGLLLLFFAVRGRRKARAAAGAAAATAAAAAAPTPVVPAPAPTPAPVPEAVPAAAADTIAVAPPPAAPPEPEPAPAPAAAPEPLLAPAPEPPLPPAPPPTTPPLADLPPPVPPAVPPPVPPSGGTTPDEGAG